MSYIKNPCVLCGLIISDFFYNKKNSLNSKQRCSVMNKLKYKYELLDMSNLI